MHLCSSSTDSNSSNEYEDVHFLKPPFGPLSAFDLFEDMVVFFDEKYNRLVVFENGNESVSKTYAVPPQYAFGQFYWAAVHFVDAQTILCLLKHHSSRLFSLVTLKLIEKEKICTYLDESLTDISTEGYQIWSQRAHQPNTFYYSFSSRKQRKKSAKEKKQLTKSVSDRTLFKNQMAQALEAESSSMETKSLQPGAVAHRRTTSTETTTPSIDIPRLVEPEVETREVVMLEATVVNGRILHRVLSVGKRSVRLRLSKSAKERREGRLSDSVRIKQTTRLSAPPSPTHRHSNSVIPPILLAGQAVFLNKDSPSEALVIPIREGTTTSLIGALAEKIRKPSSSRQISPSLQLIDGELPPSNEKAVWSDFHVEQGVAAHVAIQDGNSSEVSLWCLRVIEESPIRLEWKREESIPTELINDRVSELRLSLSPGNKACVRGNRFNEAIDESSPFCFTFNRIRIVA